MPSKGDLLNLKWEKFQKNAKFSFETLREEQESVDVTLACGDGLLFGSHKAVLASSSNLFLNLLKENPSTHPLILLPDLKTETLVAVIEFIYCGKTNIGEENLKSFLDAGKELKLKGMANLETTANFERAERTLMWA